MCDLATALQLAKSVPIFPCAPDKKPLTPRGFKDATQDRAIITAWWERWPNALPAQPTGIGTTVVTDLDVKDGTPAADRARAFFNGHQAPPTLIYETVSGGWHIHFAAARPTKNSVEKLAPNVDFRGDGGYVVRWDAEGCRVLCDEDPAPIPEWLFDRVKADRRPKADQAPTGTDIGEGRRNATLASMAGAMRRRGMSVAAIEVALLAENAARCNPPLPDAEVRQIAASVGRYAPAAPEPEPETEPPDWRFDAPPLGVEEPPADDVDDDPGGDDTAAARVEFPAVEVSDLIGEAPPRMRAYVTWALENSSRRVPSFALAGALAMVGHVCGRGYVGPTGLGPGLYQVLLGPTDSGKDACAFDPIERLAVGAEDLVTYCDARHWPLERLLSRFGSGQAVEKSMERSPAVTLVVSEMGYMLSRAAGGSDHLAALRELALRVFGKDSSKIAPKAYADAIKAKSMPIDRPNLAIIGGMTEKHLKLIDRDALQEGLLNRFVVVPAPRPRFETITEIQPPPSALCAWAAEVTERIYPRPPAEGQPPLPIPNPQPVQWASVAAKQTYTRIAERAANETDDNPLNFRHGMKLIKAALAMALARDSGPNCAITAADVEWADTWLQRCNAAAIVALLGYGGLVASEHQADMVKLCEALKGVESVYATRLFKHRSRHDRERILKSAYDVALVNFRDRAGYPMIPGPGVLPRGAVVVPRQQEIVRFMATVRSGEEV